MAIPNEWFGNSKEAMSLGRKLWESDIEHQIILHPYVFEAHRAVIIEIHILKRFPNSQSYRELITGFLSKIQDSYKDSPHRAITIDVCYRDTVDNLAMFDWIQENGYVTYKDEYTGKTKIEKPGKWRILV